MWYSVDMVYVILISFFVVWLSIDLYFRIKEIRRVVNIRTVNSLSEIMKTIDAFLLASKDIKTFTVSSFQWYRAVVDPYVDFLFILYLSIDNKIISVSILKRLAPRLSTNYDRIKPYIDFQQKKWGKKAWEELVELNRILNK